MIAHVTDTVAHELVIMLGDAHVYMNHTEALEVVVGREPRAFPKVRYGYFLFTVGCIIQLSIHPLSFN